ncbi:hypothetical protein J3B02_002821 [Coemansia erecta]|uniref:EamA domain-containing protein n=1 Tax=Coemansia asiatica TaxID=1052880 RepID=A0A9W8CFM6_9FUNG|nr:hypothetical protein LPJ64_006225 [Coemansia asiatica]KAJ2854139.1 hypothetical protein J3B02_002821 [Coemansia erecta]
MPEIQPDHFAKQYPNKYNPPEYKYVLAPSNFFAILGGAFAALGSVSAKLAVAQDQQQTSMLTQLIHQVLPETLSNARALAAISRGMMLGCIALCNFFMWLFFTKALRFGDSTPRVMMLQTISNFAVTALCGVYLFGDVLSLQWWGGASLIAIGLVMLNSEKNVGFEYENPDHAHEINGFKESKKIN